MAPLDFIISQSPNLTDFKSERFKTEVSGLVVAPFDFIVSQNFTDLKLKALDLDFWLDNLNLTILG